MGASMALWLAARVPDAVAATAVFYGGQDIDMVDARSAFLGHYAEVDPYVDEDGLVLLESELHLDGLDVEFHRYPGTAPLVRRGRPSRARPRGRRPGLGPHPRLLPRAYLALAVVEGGAEAGDASRRGPPGPAPSRRWRISADATTTPSACAAAVAGLLGRGDAEAHDHRAGRWCALRRLASTVDESASSVRSPVTPSRFTP